MEIDLTQASTIQVLLNKEIEWLTYQITKAPEGLQAELQAMVDSRQAAQKALTGEIAKVMVAVPIEAQEAANKYITSE